MPVVCQTCGAQNADENAFCQSCGRPLPRAAVEGTAAPPAVGSGGPIAPAPDPNFSAGPAAQGPAYPPAGGPPPYQPGGAATNPAYGSAVAGSSPLSYYQPATQGAVTEFDMNDPVNSFVQTAKLLVTAPQQFFAAIDPRGGFQAPLAFAVICGVISGVLQWIVQLASGRAGIGGIIAALIVGVLGGVLGPLIGGAIVHLFVMLFVKPNAGYRATVRASAYSAVTSLITWIPFVGGLVGGIWAIVLGVIAIKTLHRTTTGRALAVVLVPAAIAIVIALAVAAVVAAIFIAALRGG